MKCPDCTEELESMMKTFYRCSNCKQVFIIITEDQFNQMQEFTKNLSEKTLYESETAYRKMMEKDSV